MKLLRNDNSILEINANDINEIKVKIIDPDYKCQIIFIANDLKFKKEIQMIPHERGGLYEEIFLTTLNKMLRKQLSYHKEYDKYYPNRFIFNVDEMFNESVRISQKEFITKYIPALFQFIKE